MTELARHLWFAGVGTPCGIPVDYTGPSVRSTPDRGLATCAACLLALAPADRSMEAFEAWLTS